MARRAKQKTPLNTSDSEEEEMTPEPSEIYKLLQAMTLANAAEQQRREAREITEQRRRETREDENRRRQQEKQEEKERKAAQKEEEKQQRLHERDMEREERAHQRQMEAEEKERQAERYREQKLEEQRQFADLLDQTMHNADRRRARDDEEAKIPWTKVPSYKKMDAKADIDDYLSGFENHMTSYMVRKDKWPILLAPLLNDLVGRVYHRFEAAMKADYDAAKAELEIQFHISEASHRKKLRDLTKSPDEAWTMFAQRHNYLQGKWLDAYPTRKDVLQAYGKETILETMPRSLAITIIY